MLIPERKDLRLYPGLKFDPLFVFYSDRAHTQLFPLGGYSAQMEIGNGALVLSSAGGGLTLGGAAGSVQAFATAAQTANLPPGILPWFLSWTPSAGQPDCPVAGNVLVKAPSP